jgi:outer membrane protein TolC
VAWDEERARYLTREGEQALRRLKTKAPETSDGLSARLEVLMTEKRAAYETRNMQRYEAALQAIVHQAQDVFGPDPEPKKRPSSP